MARNEPIGAPSSQRLERLRDVWALLLEAHDDARDVGRDPWEFAVSRADLRAAGISDSGLRWLRCQGWIDLAAELPVRGGRSRRFRALTALTIEPATCAVLNASGVPLARAILARPAGAAARSDPPHWDSAAQELRFSGRLIKRFRFPAPNQALVLAVFEEEGWPPRIDDPLPPHPEQDAKRRLLDTIKCLNRGQVNHLLRFHGDGCGRGVRWRVVPSCSHAT